MMAMDEKDFGVRFVVEVDIFSPTHDGSVRTALLPYIIYAS